VFPAHLRTTGHCSVCAFVVSSVVAEARRVGRGSAGLEDEYLEHSSSGREPRRLQSSSIAADGALRPRGLWGTEPAAWGSLQVRMCLIRPWHPAQDERPCTRVDRI
jgi:hypothetical protein